jgi:protein-S-isoprenylcysteine O-methyltransferase Ste14
MDLWFWLFSGPWIVFGAWWIIRAMSAAKTASRESVASSISHRVFLGLGALTFILDSQGTLGRLSTPLWRQSLALALVSVALVVGGVAFAIWARETLGRYWSGTITLKEGHRVIKTGPYALARHPIYTGLMTAFVGTALVRGDVAGMIAVALMAIGIGRKIAIEERLLSTHFGAEYGAYKQQVKTIIPFIL